MNLFAASTRANVFLDANVVLEILLSRPQEAAARAVLDRYAGRLAISALTAHLIVHFGLARVDLSVIRLFLQDYEILSLEDADFAWAFVNARTNDFEDGLQLGVGIRHGCQRFVTFDQRLYEAYNDLPTIGVELVN